MDTTINPKIQHKAEIIAATIASGGTVGDGMEKAGYARSTARHFGLHGPIREAVADILETHRASNGQSVLNRINKLSRCADKAVDRISDGTADRLDVEQAKLQAGVLKDYADRLGLSLKVNKTASVRLNIESDGPEALKALKDRINYLKGLSVTNLDRLDDSSDKTVDKTDEVLAVVHENGTDDQTGGDSGVDSLLPTIG